MQSLCLHFPEIPVLIPSEGIKLRKPLAKSSAQTSAIPLRGLTNSQHMAPHNPQPAIEPVTRITR
jgi:hypothetical protein